MGCKCKYCFVYWLTEITRCMKLNMTGNIIIRSFVDFFKIIKNVLENGSLVSKRARVPCVISLTAFHEVRNCGDDHCLRKYSFNSAREFTMLKSALSLHVDQIFCFPNKQLFKLKDYLYRQLVIFQFHLHFMKEE